MDALIQQYVRSEEYRKALDLPTQVTEVYTPLAQGEYNINYVFTHPKTGQKLVFRLNTASQMHLDHQIEYEYNALVLLQNSGRTPKPLFVDGTKSIIPYGVLVMEWLPGDVLHYEEHLFLAADCLADIHATDATLHRLMVPEKPLLAILEECETMFSHYKESPLAKKDVIDIVTRMLTKGWEKANAFDEPFFPVIVNTEINSTNFLVKDGFASLVDWEKPLFSDPAQDLGHFLAPTTTFWKTDVILDDKTMDAWIDAYVKAVRGRFPLFDIHTRTKMFIAITCLRGITWSAMAWIQYQDPDKLIFNQSTFDKLKAYLDSDLLASIEERFFTN